MVYSNTAFWGGNECGKTSLFFEALNDAFEVQVYQGFIFTPCQRQ